MSSNNGTISAFIGSKWATVAVVIAAATGAVLVPTVTGGGSGSTCDRNATTSTLSSQIAAATSGQTICLATGDYGAWTGTNKSVTLRPQDGATPVLALELNNGDGNFTVDGLDVAWGAVDGNAGSFTVRNSTVEGIVRIETTGSNILWTGNRHLGTNVQSGAPAGRITVFGSGSNVVIRDNLFDGGCADGVQIADSVTVEDNEFRDIEEGACPGSPHTDVIQFLGPVQGAVIRGNWVHDSAAGIVAFDGAAGATIECNVVGGITRSGGITLYSDDTSTVQWNTVYGGNSIELDRKPGDDAGFGTVVADNVTAGGVSTANGSAFGSGTHNLFSGASSPNLNGSPTFTGGSTPTSWAGFALTSLSAGFTGAQNGGQVGAHNTACAGRGPRAWA